MTTYHDPLREELPRLESMAAKVARVHGAKAPIAVMEHEHDLAGALLGELRKLTDGYSAPAWACQTFQALYHGLAELESTMHVHVHLENNVLFPRALGPAGVRVRA